MLSSGGDPSDFETQFCGREGKAGLGSRRSCSPDSPLCIAPDRQRIGNIALHHVAMTKYPTATGRITVRSAHPSVGSDSS